VNTGARTAGARYSGRCGRSAACAASAVVKSAITTDTEVQTFHDLRAIFNYDVNSCLSVGAEASAFLGGDTYEQYRAMAYLQVRFLGEHVRQRQLRQVDPWTLTDLTRDELEQRAADFFRQMAQSASR